MPRAVNVNLCDFAREVNVQLNLSKVIDKKELCERVCSKLDIPEENVKGMRRRLYDVLNVMDGIGLVEIDNDTVKKKVMVVKDDVNDLKLLIKKLFNIDIDENMFRTIKIPLHYIHTKYEKDKSIRALYQQLLDDDVLLIVDGEYVVVNENFKC